MNYLQRNRSKHSYLKQILVLIAIFVSSALLLPLLDGLFVSVFAPVWRTENTVIRSMREGVAHLNSRKNLVAENVHLKEKVSSLELQVDSLELELNKESTFLELIERKSLSGAVVASVLTYPPQTPYDVVVIDAGANDLVQVGSKVSLPEGPILGYVAEVFPSTARVRLFSTSGEETNAVLERHNVATTLVGFGAGTFKISIPRDIEVEVGDRILSTDTEASLIAVVEEIRVEPTDSFKTILARSPANIFGVRFLFIKP